MAVEAGGQLLDQADLEHRCLEWAPALDMVDRGCLAQQLPGLAAIVGREVRAHPGPQVGGLADVQRPSAAVAEHVDARAAGEPGGEAQLRHLRVASERGEGDEVVEAEHAERRRPLEQQVQEVAGCERVVERPVGGLVVEPEALGERAEAAVGHLVADQAASQPAGVDHEVVERRPAVGPRARR